MLQTCSNGSCTDLFNGAPGDFCPECKKKLATVAEETTIEEAPKEPQAQKIGIRFTVRTTEDKIEAVSVVNPKGGKRETLGTLVKKAVFIDSTDGGLMSIVEKGAGAVLKCTDAKCKKEFYLPRWALKESTIVAQVADFLANPDNK